MVGWRIVTHTSNCSGRSRHIHDKLFVQSPIAIKVRSSEQTARAVLSTSNQYIWCRDNSPCNADWRQGINLDYSLICVNLVIITGRHEIHERVQLVNPSHRERILIAGNLKVR